MGFWDVLDLLESEDRWFTSKDVMLKLKIGYNSVNKHLRKLVGLGYAVFEEQVKIIKNCKIPYNCYKATKFLGRIGPNKNG